MRKIIMYIILIAILMGYMTISIAQTVVTLGPSSSSIVSALGVNVMASDSESVKLLEKRQGKKTKEIKEVKNSKKVKDVGYMRALTIESLLSVKPNIVIADASISPLSVLTRLKAFNVQTLLLTEVKSLNDVEKNIQEIANKLNKQKEGQRLINKLQEQTKQTNKIINAYSSSSNGKPKQVLMLLQIAASGAYMLGKDTQSGRWLQLVKAHNILSFSGMRPLSKEGLMSLKPQVIVIAQASANMAKPYPEVLNYLHEKYQTKIVTIDASRIDNFGAEFGQTELMLAQKVYL
ncbi:ABC transporter substrate-binding protein [Cysteiniphilum halobium]|uniref:ABC transporter substrate-binding protein n=1 Tax=Cysteiniphilum halobium TaxID=2219059 RepID=UPI003F82E838